MDVQIASGISSADAGVDSFAEAAGHAALGLGGLPADIAIVFAAAPNLAHADLGVQIVSERLGSPAAIAGCGAQGVLADGRELETGGVAVWAASMPGAEVETFHLDVLPAGEGQMAVAGMPELEDAEAAILIADPYTFPVEPLLALIGDELPGLPIVGGLASGGGAPGDAVLIHDGEIARRGAVGVKLSGVDVHACVSQGARPVGPEMVITSCERNKIHELASRPALRRLQEAIADLHPLERMLASGGLLLGIVIDENQPEYDRGDYLIRPILGFDEREASIVVGDQVRVGQTVRLQVRDGDSADEDLRHVLRDELGQLGRPPAGALVFTCNGRGSHMFPAPDHDASAVDQAFAGAPAAGFFCAGEIGPVGDRNFVHGFTATLAVFPGGD
jgi:small ligand-binding sensory domain FIST